MVRVIDWSTIFTGAATPFSADGGVDRLQFDRVISHLSNGGLGGIVVNAMLSEGGQLSLTERVGCVAEAVRRDKRPAIIATVYGSNTRDAVEEARLVARAGADGLLIYPHPAFGGGTTDADMIVDYYSAIHDVSGLPLIVFRTPGSLAPELGVEALFALAQTAGVVAVKDSVADADFYTGPAAVFLTPNSPLKIMADNDVRLLALLRRGAHGGMSMVAAIFPRAVADLLRLRNHTAASELERAIAPLASALAADPVRDFRARIKYLLLYAGVTTSADVRRPLREPSAAQHDVLVDAYNTTKVNLAGFYTKHPVMIASPSDDGRKIANVSKCGSDGNPTEMSNGVSVE
jgi:dihydrodipicolinate synthase/N-acetylneuraminate lyase